MKPILIVSPKFTRLMSVVIDVYAITIFPFIISKEEMDEFTLNHETIHIHQQKELLLIGFYLLYFFYYFLGYIKYRDGAKAYRRIRAEQEAYDKDFTAGYLQERKRYQWIRKYKV